MYKFYIPCFLFSPVSLQYQYLFRDPSNDIDSLEICLLFKRQPKNYHHDKCFRPSLGHLNF